MAYKKCPRCNLNYIRENDSLCMICLEDLGKSPTNSAEDDDYDICPECGDNVIKSGEELCFQCIADRNKEPVELSGKKPSGWRDLVPNQDEADEFHVDLDEEIEVLENPDLDEIPLDKTDDDAEEFANANE